MSKKNNKKDKFEQIEDAANTVEKVAKKGKKLRKKSGWSLAVPYIYIGVGLILAIFFVMVKLIAEDSAGPVGLWIQQGVCGVFGGAAYLLPIYLGFIGVLGCIKDIKYRTHGNADEDEARSFARKKILKTSLATALFAMISTVLGVFQTDANSSYEFTALWSSGTEELVSGGIFGGSLAFLLVQAINTVVSAIILIILILILTLLLLGITPMYIADKIKCRREIMEEEDDIEIDERKYEKMRERELKRAKKKKLKQLQMQSRQEFEEQEGVDPDMQRVRIIKKAEPRARKEENVLSVDEATGEVLDDDEFLESFGEAEMTPINLDPPTSENKKAEDEKKVFSANEARDYGGDPAIDADSGYSFTVEDLLNDLDIPEEAEQQPAAKKAPQKQKKGDDELIELGEIDESDLVSDLANVLPDEDPNAEDEQMTMPYIFPDINMLSANKNPVTDDCQAELQNNARILKDTLKSFKVDIKEISYSRGPTITRYELRPEVGTRVRSIANLVDDIALNLATSGVRIEAPIPNKPAVGIEVPNKVRATVYLRDLIENTKFTDPKSRLTSCLGMDVGGNPIYFDIGKMPHLLIAGTTGSGKSVCINTIILSILYKARPDEVKLILIDPKQVEFTVYENIPHLYCPIVSEPKKAAGALASAVSEMERRFELIKSVGVRNIESYNEVTANDPEKEYLPKMVIIIDELADLMMTARDEVETSICRLAQKARAAGIHVILGTQRPSVDVITGLIKANVPSRIACTVTSQVDSRTIIDVAGAENLIGYGDMLFAPVGAAKPMRVQGAFVSDNEVEAIVDFIKSNNGTAKYNRDFITSMEENAKNCGMKKGASASSDFESSGDTEGGDSKFRDAVKLAIEQGKISTSLMQRKLGIGYGRAAKIIDTMEEMGYVSAADGTKPRRVLITLEEYTNRVNEGNLGEE